MFEYLYYILWSLPIIVPISTLVFEKGNCRVENTFFSPFMICLIVGFLSVPVAISYTDQARDVGTIRAQQPIIEHYETYVKELNAELNSIKAQRQLTFNHDTPVHSLTLVKHQAMKDLLDARKAVDVAKLHIEQRKIGLLGFVTEWVGN